MKISIAWFFCIVAMLVFFGEGISAARADDMTAVPTQNMPEFADMHIQLQALVNTMGFHSTNHFCVVAYEDSNKKNPVVPCIYWPTQNKFIVLGFGSDMILSTTDYFDLTRDILPNGAAIPPQDYILPWRQSDIDGVVQDCRVHGNAYTIMKTAGGWVSVSKFHQFSSVNAQLQYLVNKTAPQKINNFCVIGQKDGTFLGAYAYWKTENRLIFWLPSPYDADDLDALSDAPIQIDLKHGLRNEEDASDDRNVMQRSYAQAIIQACQKTGQNFIVKKSN